MPWTLEEIYAERDERPTFLKVGDVVRSPNGTDLSGNIALFSPKDALVWARRQKVAAPSHITRAEAMGLLREEGRWQLISRGAK